MIEKHSHESWESSFMAFHGLVTSQMQGDILLQTWDVAFGMNLGPQVTITHEVSRSFDSRDHPYSLGIAKWKKDHCISLSTSSVKLRRQNMKVLTLSNYQHLNSNSKNLKDETHLNSPKSPCWRMSSRCFEVLRMPGCWDFFSRTCQGLGCDKIHRIRWWQNAKASVSCRIQTQIQRQNGNYKNNIQ